MGGGDHPSFLRHAQPKAGAGLRAAGEEEEDRWRGDDGGRELARSSQEEEEGEGGEDTNMMGNELR